MTCPWELKSLHTCDDGSVWRPLQYVSLLTAEYPTETEHKSDITDLTSPSLRYER